MSIERCEICIKDRGNFCIGNKERTLVKRYVFNTENDNQIPSPVSIEDCQKVIQSEREKPKIQ